MKKQQGGLRSTNNHSLPATGNKDDDSNFSTQIKYKKFTNFLKESKTTVKQQKKIAECNCWVCKILDSVKTATTNGKPSSSTTTAQQYEPYNIVSDTGDSIFYDPLLLSNICDNEKEDRPRNGQIYIAADRILDFVQQDELAKKHFNGVDLNKNEY